MNSEQSVTSTARTAAPTLIPTAESAEDDASSIASAAPYVPGNRQSILDRYKADAARAEVVLASGTPVVLATDEIW